VTGWELSGAAEVVSLPSGYWTPDYQLVRSATGEVVRLEILGFWRRTDVEKLYRRLTAELDGPFILAVSENLNIDEALAEEWDGHIYRFKRTPLPGEIVKLAEAQLAGVNPSSADSGKRR
jgi:predicted nuclease of restriction endonuclease-like RecB superfamily